jgi:hypothetical protein
MHSTRQKAGVAWPTIDWAEVVSIVQSPGVWGGTNSLSDGLGQTVPGAAGVRGSRAGAPMEGDGDGAGRTRRRARA